MQRLEILSSKRIRLSGMEVTHLHRSLDLFLASLGTCAGIYVKRFCMERKISTDAIRIVQEAEPREKGGLAVIRMTIQVPPDFPEQYKQAVINAANLCTVKKVIQDPPEFQIQVETAPE